MIQIALDVLGVAVGLALGVWAGYGIGERFQARRWRLWFFAVPLVLVVLAIDFAGSFFARPEISLAALGLMAGVLTGGKYGAFPEVRLWERRPRG